MTETSPNGPKLGQVAAVVLTYHRVVAQTRHHPGFYDISVRRLGEQMALLRRRVTGTEGDALRLDNGSAAYLTFDDGTSDHAEVADLLNECGLCGTFFVIAGRIGEAGRLSAAQIRALAARGHRIASHTMTHRQLPTLSDAEIVGEISRSRAVLEQLSGRAVDWLAAPGGSLCARSLAIAEACGMRVVRTMDWGYAAMPLAGAVPCLPVLPFYALPRFERLLDGRASLWPYRLKRGIKNLIGAGRYVAYRDAVSRLGAPRG